MRYDFDFRAYLEIWESISKSFPQFESVLSRGWVTESLEVDSLIQNAAYLKLFSIRNKIEAFLCSVTWEWSMLCNRCSVFVGIITLRIDDKILSAKKKKKNEMEEIILGIYLKKIVQ